MSESEEIREVFYGDIATKSRIVRTKQGILPFLDGIDGCRIIDLYWGVISDANREFIARLGDK